MSEIKNKTLIVLFLSFFLLVSFVSAVNIVDDEVKLNVDYEKFNNEDQDFIVVNGQFVISNTNPTDKNVEISFLGLPTDYEPSTTDRIVTVTGSATRTVSFSIEIPHNKDSGEENIGYILIKDPSTNVELDRMNLIQVTENMLLFKELSVDYTSKDGSKENENFDDDQNLKLSKDVQPGTEMTFTFDIENLFDKDYDDRYSDIENIELTINVDDDQIYLNKIDEDYQLEDIRAEGKGKFTVNFEIDKEADAGEYEFEISLEGEDGKGAKHSFDTALRINLERSKNDVRINVLQVTPEKITSCDEQFNLEVELKNFGTERQRYTAVELFSERLNIAESAADINLYKHSDKDNNWRKVFQFGLEDLTPGIYPLDITVFIDKDEQIASQRLMIGVEECSLEEKVKDLGIETSKEDFIVSANEEVKEVDKEEIKKEKLTSAVVISTIEDPYTSDDFILAMFIVAIVIVLSSIVIFSVILFKKPGVDVKTINEGNKKW